MPFFDLGVFLIFFPMFQPIRNEEHNQEHDEQFIVSRLRALGIGGVQSRDEDERAVVEEVNLIFLLYCRRKNLAYSFVISRIFNLFFLLEFLI